MLKWCVSFLSIVFLAVAVSSASARDVRPCLALHDIERRVECLEGRENPQPEAIPTNQQDLGGPPSFECSKAVSPIELVICGDAILRQLDFEMGVAYAQALKSQNNSRALIDDQRQWLSSRNIKCGWGDPAIIRACLQPMTRARIAGLAAVGAVQSQQTTEKVPDKILPIESIVAPLGNQPDVGLNTQPTTDTHRPFDEAEVSKRLIESVQSLLRGSQTESVKFFRYNVDKKDLQGFKYDMPVLRIVYDERVFFDTDKDILRPEALPAVKTIAATLKQQKGKVALFVAGHTDARGTEQYNLDLSIRRAEGVARAIKKQGSGSAVIWRVGFGKALPIRPNNSEQNWAYNRRVEFLIASQANIITAWIKNANVCEDDACGITSVNSKFEATSISDQSSKPLAIEISSPEPVEIEMQFKPVEVGPPLQ
jgi:outer membrane protein OmpA-like peptidoglycan-associated protein/uncharacterized protein